MVVDLVQGQAWVGLSMSWEKSSALVDALIAVVVLMALALVQVPVLAAAVDLVAGLVRVQVQAVALAADLAQAQAQAQAVVVVLVQVLVLGLGQALVLGQGLAQDKTVPASAHSPGTDLVGSRPQTTVQSQTQIVNAQQFHHLHQVNSMDRQPWCSALGNK